MKKSPRKNGDGPRVASIFHAPHVLEAENQPSSNRVNLVNPV
jgi:hypothetical protein